MQYLLLMWGDGSSPPPPPPDDSGEPCWMPWVREMAERGVRLPAGGRLELATMPAVVRVQDGETLLTDGPFAETKEQMAGYQVIECGSREEAIYAASRHPVATSGGIVEVRELFDE
jgi:hypothetical protein